MPRTSASWLVEWLQGGGKVVPNATLFMPSSGGYSKPSSMHQTRKLCWAPSIGESGPNRPQGSIKFVPVSLPQKATSTKLVGSPCTKVRTDGFLTPSIIIAQVDGSFTSCVVVRGPTAAALPSTESYGDHSTNQKLNPNANQLF
jgi:hypothetical protein